jgi:hypothetical protein
MTVEAKKELYQMSEVELIAYFKSLSKKDIERELGAINFVIRVGANIPTNEGMMDDGWCDRTKKLIMSEIAERQLLEGSDDKK